MAPPVGPRGSSSLARGKQTTRGGSARGGSIQKRRAASNRLDRDGDVSMDASSGGGRGSSSRGSGRTAPLKRGSITTRSSSRTAQNVALYGDTRLAALEARGGRGGRVSMNPSKARFAHTAILKIHGLKESKAATNSDGGMRSLLTFLERKASKGDKQVTIQKVRFIPRLPKVPNITRTAMLRNTP